MELLSALRDVCDIVWIVDAGDPSLGPMARLLPRSGTVVDTGGRATADVVDELRDHRVDGVVAFTDRQLRTVATIGAALGVDGNPVDVVDRLNDKYLQRSAFEAAEIAGPRFRRIPPTADGAAAVALVADLSFPIVLKPLQGDSSRDVVSLPDTGALADHLARMPAEERAELIAEEYLLDRHDGTTAGLGSYVSVESMARDGQIVPLAVTGKFPLVEPFREAGNFMPHPLDEADAATVIELSIAAAQALGVRSGALHTEIKLTPDGPRVIEVNGRIGGGAIDPLFTRRFGRSLTELAALVALGQDVDLPTEAPAAWTGPFSYEYFAQPPTSATGLRAFGGLGAVVGTAGAEELTVNKSPGDHLDWRKGSQGYVLRVTGTAADLATLVSVPTEILAAAAIEYL